jgi:hypothetical protein
VPGDPCQPPRKGIAYSVLTLQRAISGSAASPARAPKAQLPSSRQEQCRGRRGARRAPRGCVPQGSRVSHRSLCEAAVRQRPRGRPPSWATRIRRRGCVVMLLAQGVPVEREDGHVSLLASVRLEEMHDRPRNLPVYQALEATTAGHSPRAPAQRKPESCIHGVLSELRGAYVSRRLIPPPCSTTCGVPRPAVFIAPALVCSPVASWALRTPHRHRWRARPISSPAEHAPYVLLSIQSHASSPCGGPRRRGGGHRNPTLRSVVFEAVAAISMGGVAGVGLGYFSAGSAASLIADAPAIL